MHFKTDILALSVVLKLWRGSDQPILVGKQLREGILCARYVIEVHPMSMRRVVGSLVVRGGRDPLRRGGRVLPSLKYGVANTNLLGRGSAVVEAPGTGGGRVMRQRSAFA